MIENKFGELISTLRKSKNLTQKMLADKLAISDKAISRWETGKSYPSLEMIYHISKFFDVSFKDLMTARMMEDSEENDVVEAIIKEFSKKDKRKIKIIQTILVVALIIILALTITMIFTNSYNRFKVYQVYIESDELIASSGVYVETKIKDSFDLGNIEIKYYDVKNTDTVTVDLYYLDNGEEKIIQSYSGLKDINFTNYQSYIDIKDLSDYFDNLYIKVIITDKDNKISEYKGKLEFVLDFSNNKVFYIEDNPYSKNPSSDNLTQEEIMEILLKNNFVETSNNMFSIETKEYKIIYFSNTNKFEYDFTKNDLYFRYIYGINNSILEVSIANDANIEIENYKYDNKEKKITECNTGSCNNYEEVMKTLNDKVLNLLHK